MMEPRLFTRAELLALGRCPECGWHPRTQGHQRACPARKQRRVT